MITEDAIEQVVAAQRANMIQRGSGQRRKALSTLPDLTNYALIVSGVRRCGKSTLLYQLLEERYRNALYLNFEDPRLYGFDLKDFTRLDNIIARSGTTILLFDEIQIISDWERYVRQKLDESFQVVITGSNASLLSKELGTKLTGRHITKELFPFSFEEFTEYTNQPMSKDSLADYLYTGGFPEYVKQRIEDILHYVLEDILLRDIAIRHNIRDVNNLQKLALYLISNVGKPFSANRLKSMIGIGSTSTVTEYLSHLEDSYLLQSIPKFDYSLRKQAVNPRKVYAIDTGLVKVNSSSFSKDDGRLLENLIYTHLRRLYRQIYYFSERHECDFVIFDRTDIQAAIQVCYTLTQDNLEREMNGLLEAMRFFGLREGFIVTFSQTDRFIEDDMTIHVVPAHDYLATDGSTAKA